MTREDYIQIAAVIKTQLDYWKDYQTDECVGAVTATENIAYELSRIMITNNPRFDRDKFMEACGCTPTH